MAGKSSKMPTFYNMKRLHIIFFSLSFVWFILLMVMMWHDFDREWRSYQKSFRVLQLQKTKARIEAFQKSEEGQQLEELRAQLKETQEKLKGKEKKIKDIMARIRGLEAKYYIADQQWRFAKSERDAIRYQYEVALQENSPKLPELEQKLKHVEDRVQKWFDESMTITNQIDALKEQIALMEKESAELKKKILKIGGTIDRLEKRVADIKPSLRNFLRDLPLLDFMVPALKIKQVYITDLYHNFTFRLVERADRCTSCHLGIDDPDYKDAPQPYRTHPNLELMVGSSSPHPLDQFGCTICHMGRDRGTSFVTAAHMPRDEKQADVWRRKYNWKPMELWEEPMLPVQYTEATCYICHKKQTHIKGADKFNTGMTLVRRLGCYGCHKIEGFEYLRKAGPSLAKIASKVQPEWMYQWILDPKAFRPTWMPKIFMVSNTSDDISIKRNKMEILGIVTYLMEKSVNETYPPPPSGDPQNGKDLLRNLGCLGCHTETPEDWGGLPPDSRRKFGPNLSYLGSKVSAGWLYAWLLNPRGYWHQTRMADLRLSQQEAADMTAYLIQQKHPEPEFFTRALPEPDEKVLDDLIFEALKTRMTRMEISDKIRSMSLQDKLLFIGEKSISHYGCFGCHDIPGFENALPIGTELTYEGDKPLHQLDFGYIHIEHTRWSWFRTKLHDPRIFDRGRRVSHYEKLRMPDFQLKHDDIEALVTFILGLKNEVIVHPSKRKQYSKAEEDIWEGWKIVYERNCTGCHQIGYEGGDIRAVFEKYGVPSGMEPPVLKYEDRPGIGARVRTDWLYHFLDRPTLIRPWLKVRMPTFYLDDHELNTLTAYFAALDQVKYPFENSWFQPPPQQFVSQGKHVFDLLRCVQCHPVGEIDLSKVDLASLAPNLSMVYSRIRPEWITDWLKDPSRILPGTKMPTYPWQALAQMPDFQGMTEDTMIQAIRNYLLSFSYNAGQPSAGASSAQ